ncbi:NTP transferase domain-containing protein [Methylobacter sp. Wu1]|uniref:nucleotidyltransferase family protein n=1 Tax=Methylobacter sp. Wu1 TaxID=3119359 RepID=UPI002F94EA08
MNAYIDNVYAIVLAAGASSRMGQPLLASECSLNFDKLAHAEPIQAAIDLGAVTAIINPDWQEGIASSIRTGVQALPEPAAATLILLADQPLITTARLQKLLHDWQSAPLQIVASQYHRSGIVSGQIFRASADAQRRPGRQATFNAIRK